MSYISASPFVYQEVVGLSEIGYGVAFAINAVGMVCATMASSRLIDRVPLRVIGAVGLGAGTVGTVAALSCALAGVDSWPLLVALFVAVAPLGMVLGNVSALAMSAVSPRTTGLASAILGLAQFALAGTVAALVGLGGEDTAVPMAALMLVCAAVSAAGLVVAGRVRERAAETVVVS